MRKVNKILMATISILLCLVLISTSVVSGIFAKYVVTKKGQSIVQLERFGVTLSVSGGGDLLPDEVTITPTLNYANNTVAVEVKNLQLAPGDSIDDVVIFQVEGTPNVPIVDFKIKVDVGLTNCLVETNANLPDITGGDNCNYMPIGFTAKNAADAAPVVVLPPWSVVGEAPDPASDQASDQAKAIAQGIKNGFTALAFSGTQDQITSRIWDTSLTNNALKITYFSFGFNCYRNGAPNAPTGQDPANEAEAHRIQTYLQAKGAAITVTYTVTLEQYIP